MIDGDSCGNVYFTPYTKTNGACIAEFVLAPPPEPV